MLGGSSASNSDDTVEFDRMTEEDLLRGLDGLVPPAGSADDDND
jgi:DNA-directed RNA polymerase subunit omega